MNSKFYKYSLCFCALLSVTVSAFGQAGQLDATFGKGGIATQQAVTTTENFFSVGGVAIQSDGKIVIAGGVPENNGPALLRFLSNGALDKTFGVNGIAILPNSTVPFSSVAIQSDGKILAGGIGSDGVDGEIDRFTNTGNLDTSFGASGRVIFSMASTQGLAVQPDGRILVALEGIQGSGLASQVTRLLNNGAPDTTFGTNGFAVPPGGSGPLAVVANGDILVFSGLISKLTDSGAVDTTFGVSGQLLVPTSVNAQLKALTSVHALAANGDILVAGTLVNDPAIFSSGLAAFAYQSVGIGDPAFGKNGGVSTPFASFPTVIAAGVGVESTGDIVELATLFPTVSTVGTGAFGLVRYTPQGQLDTNFGSGGTVATGFGNNATPSASSIAIQSDNKIVVAGTVLTPGLHGALKTALVVARYLSK